MAAGKQQRLKTPSFVTQTLTVLATLLLAAAQILRAEFLDIQVSLCWCGSDLMVQRDQ